MEGDGGGGGGGDAAGGVGVEVEKVDAPPVLSPVAAAGEVEKVAGPPPLVAAVPVIGVDHLAVVREDADQAAAAAGAVLARAVEVQREPGGVEEQDLEEPLLRPAARAAAAAALARAVEVQRRELRAVEEQDLEEPLLRPAAPAAAAAALARAVEVQRDLGAADQVADTEQVIVVVEEQYQDLEEPLLRPAAPAAAAARPAFYRLDSINVILAVVTVTVLGLILVAQLGLDITSWASLIKGMSAKDLAPNCAGVILFLVQASQIVVYRRRKPQQEDGEDVLHRPLLGTADAV